MSVPASWREDPKARMSKEKGLSKILKHNFSNRKRYFSIEDSDSLNGVKKFDEKSLDENQEVSSLTGNGSSMTRYNIRIMRSFSVITLTFTLQYLNVSWHVEVNFKQAAIIVLHSPQIIVHFKQGAIIVCYSYLFVGFVPNFYSSNSPESWAPHFVYKALVFH